MEKRLLDCFYAKKNSTDSLQCVWRTKMRVHMSSFFFHFTLKYVVFSDVPNMMPLRNLPVYKAEEVKEPLQRCLRHIQMFISRMLKCLFA